MFASQLTVSDGISACSSASRAEENQKKYSIFNRCPRWRRSDILVVLRFVRWLVLKNTHHSFNRSDAITTWSFAFSRATGYLVVLYFELSLVPCKVDLGSDWLDLWLCVFISIIDQIAQYRYKHNFLSTRQYTKFIPFLVIFNSALSSSFMQLNLCSKGKLWRKKTKKKQKRWILLKAKQLSPFKRTSMKSHGTDLQEEWTSGSWYDDSAVNCNHSQAHTVVCALVCYSQ